MKKMMRGLGKFVRNSLIFLLIMTVVVSILEIYERDKSDRETAFREAAQEDARAEKAEEEAENDQKTASGND